MSRKPIVKAEVTAYYLAGDAARLASSIARLSTGFAPVYVELARKEIEAMRDALNKIEAILETEAENSGDRNKNRGNGDV
jgi:5-methylcytosine-specific restriction endonuclease McrBC GTP-binding regulatory subunit McrB